MYILFAWLVFWDYHNEKDEDKRNNQLAKLLPFLLFSQITFLIGVLLILSLLDNQSDEVVSLMGILLSIVGVIQFFFQQSVCYNAFQKSSKIKSLKNSTKKTISLMGNLSVLVVGGLILEFEEIISDFYKGYEEDSRNKNENSTHSNYYGDRNGSKAYKESTGNNDYEDSTYSNSYEEDNTNSNTNDYKNETNNLEHIYIKYELPLDTDVTTIKKRFRTLAKQLHPDMPQGDEKLFIELREDMYFLMDYLKLKASA
ncbi:J domain-containing protein [Jeotgalibacillus proteolyticus]|uniref:J domain-containing protein n=1 Tax=Jeotgalibacillus proteolyticus TaxID=2082395 RepID=A0A2S5GFQ0_9BACL|nr:J domain-containing protein [Jeotgalibacillus proteolyticus]PPA71809.1 hypothetical protein C4B60_00060 [Jeotgalibacillus proteolyticus]